MIPSEISYILEEKNCE